MSFKNKLIQFFYGRYISYGLDSLTKFIIFACLFIAIANLFIMELFWPLGILLHVIQSSLLIWSVIRMFSKNITMRQKENEPFAKLENKIVGKIQLRKRMHSEKATHVYKKCPHCSVILRLPRKPGKHNVNCPRCKNDFSVTVK